MHFAVRDPCLDVAFPLKKDSCDNNSEETNKCLFWVSPARKLYDLFWGIHNLGPSANPAEVVELSAKHEVDFLPPPEDQ